MRELKALECITCKCVGAAKINILNWLSPKV
jgi:hypothetical protein